MAPRHWTILLIPPGNEPTRSFVVTERARKALGGASGAVAALLAAAIFALTSPYATPAGRIAAAENARLRARLAEISDLSRYDFRLYMGNFFLHQKTFGVLGM